MVVSRRHFLLGAAAVPALAADRRTVERPSFLLVIPDELPAWILGCYGNKEVRTPNIDRLAAMGTLFTNHAACAPLPSAGRATLLSGLTPMQLGAGDPAAAARGGLEKLLGAAGYTCHTAGSVDEAGKFLEQQTPDKPFLLVAALSGPRAPEDVPKKYLEPYARTNFETFGYEPVSQSARRGKEMFADIAASLRRYAAAVSALDDNVAALLAALTRRKLESAAIVLTSGSGALLGRHGIWGGADSSDPINMYQESVATPMIWSWLGRVPAQTTRPEPVGAYDLLPSICDAAGVKPEGKLCGRSYLPFATGKLLGRKEVWPTTVYASCGNTDMARDRRYKLVSRDGGKGPGALFDLVRDPRERIDQYTNDQFLTVRNELAGELAEWKQKFSA